MALYCDLPVFNDVYQHICKVVFRDEFGGKNRKLLIAEKLLTRDKEF
jgi:hypothetical protein